MDAADRATDGWEPTLAAALLGAERAPPSQPGPLSALVAESDPAGALLARLAAEGAHHLAGTGLGPEALAPAEPREAVGSECPPAAATRLYGLLTEGHGARGRVEEWFALAAASGLRPPAWLFQALMLHRDSLPATAPAVVGAELDWLARACGEAPAETREAADWTEGTVTERRAAFAAFRARDPEGARAALEPVFRKEKADIREALVHALATGLSPADEPFLEACLDDRAGGVRLAAQRLLPGLPGSRYAGRMAARARAALTIESKRRLLGGTTHTLVVTLPEEAPELARDGVEVNAWERRGGGARAGLLRAILARAPLHAFAEHPPRLWIELALRSEWADPVFHGLFSAAKRTRDPAWTKAMADITAEAYEGKVTGVRRTNEVLGMWAEALDLLPDAEWEARVGALIRARKIEVVLAVLGQGPEHFSEGFSAGLLDWLAFVTRGSDALRRDLAKPWVIARLGDRLWPSDDNAAAAAALLARLPEGEGDRLRTQLAGLTGVLDLRAAIRRDFRPETTTGGTAQG
ncbi:hypothetical protein HNR01_002180 [Methylorubrum rhodesianum]|uniref:DUF5691 domain-containing protein n=2 Tax=Methylorubrum rhodesianum TaxID=29427 RepID=A0ABU9ZA09_9HYPH|nr:MULTISPECIES: DUF5691 domain-containing protein [Methylorubrum]MBB5762554.1 hypothetical protein [Methylorubrum rhodesianum]MBI1688609.1 hypothetical protein [Methylorubrum sp. DB1722]MBK3402348.1 hypothetical protein [Methylorubrum rhodesianum]MBY0142503.1 hypothetical protein [Methylorubrum populi]